MSFDGQFTKVQRTYAVVPKHVTRNASPSNTGGTSDIPISNGRRATAGGNLRATGTSWGVTGETAGLSTRKACPARTRTQRRTSCIFDHHILDEDETQMRKEVREPPTYSQFLAFTAHPRLNHSSRRRRKAMNFAPRVRAYYASESPLATH